MKKIAFVCILALILVSCKKVAPVTVNQFFFPKDTETVTYTAFADGNEFVVTARLVNKGIYMDGALYELVFDSPVGTLSKLGDFYVDETKIYKVNSLDVQNLTLVCSPEDIPDKLGKDGTGIHITIFGDEEKSKFISYDDSTNYFEEISWEKGVGLVAFSCVDNETNASLEIIR